MIVLKIPVMKPATCTSVSTTNEYELTIKLMETVPLYIPYSESLLGERFETVRLFSA